MGTPNYLTANEIERIAYLNSQSLLACYAGENNDMEDEIFNFDDRIEAAEKEAFEKGRVDGIGVVAATEIERLEGEIETITASHRRTRDRLQAVLAWLQSPDCKTVAGRRDFERHVRTVLNVTARY
jgi:hypothetical protein